MDNYLLTNNEKSYFLFFLMFVGSSGGLTDEEYEKIVEVGLQIGATRNLVEEARELFISIKDEYHNETAEDVDKALESTSGKNVYNQFGKASNYFLTRDDKELCQRLYKGLIRVASVDGNFDKDERARVRLISKILQLTFEECVLLELEVSRELVSELSKEIKKLKNEVIRLSNINNELAKPRPTPSFFQSIFG